MASTARLDELKKKFDENPRRYFAPLANEHRKSGDLDQAISLCRAHLPQQPAHISGHIVLAQALFEAGSVDESRDIFLAALGLDPENLIALRYLGDIARDAQDVDTARAWYHRVLEVDPRNDEIVQLVRDLDTPRPAVAEVAPAEPEAAEPVASSAALPPSAPATPVVEDPRYAPLSMDTFDVGEFEPHAEAVAASSDTAAPAIDEGSFEVDAAWNVDTPSVELPVLDTPEIDPFDLHPSASAESLFDAGDDAGSDDFFLTELSGVNAPDLGDPAAALEQSAWSATPAEETRVEPTSDAPVAAAESEAPNAEAASFEEGAFYIEDAPSAPAEASDPAGADISALDETTPVTASTAAVVHAPATEAEENTVVAQSVDAADVDHNAEALALFADGQTAEWQPPAAPVNETVGLEVMEFVPPSSELAGTVNQVSSDADPLVGRAPEIAGTEHVSPPAAFVTETMAELYLQQGFRNEALAVYRELLARNPEDASLRDRIEQIESGSMSSIGMAMLSESVVDSAMKRQTVRPSRSVRSFFASLAGRRAPMDELHAPQTQQDTDDAHVDGADADAMMSEPVPIATLSATPSLTEISEPHGAHRVTPSAAETLATFDPFADTTDMPMDASAAEPVAPNVAPLQSAEAMPDLKSMAESLAAPLMAMEPEQPPARRSLEDLFPDTPVTARTETAAQTFATAFGRDEPQGRPTRAASNELSLDHVFRGAPEGAPAPDGSFSFDQFFSDSRPAGGDVATAPTVSASQHGRGGPPNDGNDIEQFTAWLEGLKKK
jgi:tetratricopeptide (TPR) repeat protein